MFPSILKNILIVGSGSFIGGAARYLVSIAMRGVGKNFPLATLSVNLIGCFLIGILMGVFAKNAVESNNWTLFLTVGLCGGFTTFSTFSKEALIMLQSNHVWLFFGYVAISMIAGIVLVFLGYILAK